MGNSLLGTPVDTQGALESLREQLIDAPIQREAARARRDTAAQAYQTQLGTPVPEAKGLGTAVQEYLRRYAAPGGNTDPARTMVGAIGQASAIEQSQAIADQARQDKAAGFGYQFAEKDLGEIDNHTKNFIAAFRGAGGIGKQPSPEKLSEVYKAALNNAAQTAKDRDFKFGSADERMIWIQQQADAAVANYIEKFATQPTGPRGQPALITPEQTPADKPIPEQTLPTDDSLASGQARWAANGAGRNIQLIEEAIRAAGNDPDRRLVLQQELETERAKLTQQPPMQQQPNNTPGGGALGGLSAAATVAQSRPNAAGVVTVRPAMRNIPAEEGAKQGAKDMAGAYVDDYKTIQAEATAAAQQKAAFDALGKIRPKTGLFANTEQVVGSLFSALGQDPSDPLIQNAMKTRSAEQVLSQLTNASLKAEKGVQTKTDEVRIYKEFPKTTDFQKVWDFSIKLGKERAQRKLEQRDFFDSVASANNGTPTAARQKWDREMASDPITQYLGGQLIFRSDFINAYVRKYPQLGTEGAVAKWREMEQEYQGRGGRK